MHKVGQLYLDLRDVTRSSDRKRIIQQRLSINETIDLLKLGGHEKAEELSLDGMLYVLEAWFFTPTFLIRVYEARIAELEAKCQPDS